MNIKEKMKETQHLLKVLQDTKEAIEKEDTIKLKELSNQTIHSASITQETEYILLAVIIYSLSKMIERTNYREYPGWNSFFKELMGHLEHAIFALKQKKEDKFVAELRKIRSVISRLTGSLKRQIQDVFKKASINKASRIYEHGISMEKTSKLLGISIWELAEYAGQTGVSDVDLNITLSEKQRIKIASDIFK